MRQTKLTTEIERKMQKHTHTTTMTKDILILYKQVSMFKNKYKHLVTDIRKQLQDLWLQRFPKRSSSTRQIGRLLNKYLSTANDGQSSNPTLQQNSTTEQKSTNIPGDCTALRNLRQASITLSIRLIFKYICYNCGHLITDDIKHTTTVF